MSVMRKGRATAIAGCARDRPRAKAVVELQGCRSRRSWGAATEKRVDLGSLCHIEHETAPPFVAAPQQRAFPKIRCGVIDRKASPDAPDLFFGILFWSSRPEHNQKPKTDTANRHCSLIPTRRKSPFFPQGGQSTAPLARGRSRARRNGRSCYRRCSRSSYRAAGRATRG